MRNPHQLYTFLSLRNALLSLRIIYLNDGREYICVMLAIFNGKNNTEQFRTKLDTYITQKAIPPGKTTSRELGAYIHLA